MTELENDLGLTLNVIHQWKYVEVSEEAFYWFLGARAATYKLNKKLSEELGFLTDLLIERQHP